MVLIPGSNCASVINVRVRTHGVGLSRVHVVPDSGAHRPDLAVIEDHSRVEEFGSDGKLDSNTPNLAVVMDGMVRSELAGQVRRAAMKEDHDLLERAGGGVEVAAGALRLVR